MKLPFNPPQNNISSATNNSKQLVSNSNNNLSGSRPGYEPKSVLDVHRSPSPITTNKPDFSTDLALPSDDPLQYLDDHGMLINQFELDSLIGEFGLHDDVVSNSNPPSKSVPQFAPILDLPEFPPHHSFDSTTQFYGNLNEWENNDNNNGFDCVDELIRIAECLETQSLELAHVILARLNQRLRSPLGKPLQRTAFYFKEAFQSLLTGSAHLTRPSTSSEIVQAIKAYKTFSNVSPIPMFANFTANQAILEAVEGSTLVHVIDFDVGLGCHWASFMKEIAGRTKPPALKITAIVPEEYETESRLIKDNLYQFAFDLKIKINIDFVSIRAFEFLSFKAINFAAGEKTAVVLSPTIFRRIGAGFVNDLRRLAPHVIVHVDSEGMMGDGMTSFRQTVIDGLEFYSTILESLEAANIGEWMRKIEMFVLLPKIVAAVEAAGRHMTPWTEAVTRAGIRPVGLSQFADFQAECLLRRVQVRGFHVVKRQAELVLCWHNRPLVATSAWRC